MLNRYCIGALLGICAGATAFAASDDEFTIKAAPAEPVKTSPKSAENQIHPTPLQPDQMLAGSLNTPYWKERYEYYQKVAEASKSLAPTGSASEVEKQAAISLMKKDTTRATEALLSCIDPRNPHDQVTKLGALKAIEALRANHPTVSTYLAMSAVADPDETIRKASVALIKARKDDAAEGVMLNYLMADFDGAGKVIDPKIRDQAVEGLHALKDDKRLYSTLLYYVTLELRDSNVEASTVKTRQIDTFQNIGGLIIPVSVPIQFPELKITQVKTTVRIPAINALESLSGQDIGMDPAKWERWIRHNVH